MEEQIAEYRRRQRERFFLLREQQPAEFGVDVVVDRENQQQVPNSNCEEFEATALPSGNTSFPNGLDLVFWNIDGLNETHLELRTLALVEEIIKLEAAAVCLQEVVAETHRIIEAGLSHLYSLVTPSTSRVCGPPPVLNGLPPYYCLMLLHKRKLIERVPSKVVWFATSVMGRHVLAARVSPQAHPEDEIILITSHIESCKEHAAERRKQLNLVFNLMADCMTSPNHYSQKVAPPSSPSSSDLISASSVGSAFFGGDLNARDADIAAAAPASGIEDVWKLLGSPENVRYTWDTATNDNVKISGPFQPRMRFDRVFCCFRPQPASLAFPESFGPNVSRGRWRPKRITFVGDKRLAVCGMFPSDHYGLLINLERSIADCEDSSTNGTETLGVAARPQSKRQKRSVDNVPMQPKRQRRK